MLLSCEVEALSIDAAINYFTLFFFQSSHATEILTVNRPCVKAYEKLMHGEFSSSSSVTTVLSIQLSLPCSHQTHRSMEFQTSEATILVSATARVVRFASSFKRWKTRVSMGKVIDGSAKMPFTSRVAGHASQLLSVFVVSVNTLFHFICPLCCSYSK